MKATLIRCCFLQQVHFFSRKHSHPGHMLLKKCAVASFNWQEERGVEFLALASVFVRETVCTCVCVPACVPRRVRVCVREGVRGLGGAGWY